MVPTAITTCTDTSGVLSGFQVFISKVYPIAGAAHGDMSTSCRKQTISGPIVQVDFFEDTTNAQLSGNTTIGGQLVGMRLRTQFDFNSNGEYTDITAGDVSTVGLKKYSHNYPALSEIFFGFKSTTVTSGTGYFTNVSLISYKPNDLASELYSDVWDGVVDSDDNNSQARSDALAQFDSSGNYWSANVVANRRKFLSMPVAQANPDVLNIWRPEDQARVESEIGVEQRRISVFRERAGLDDSVPDTTAAEPTVEPAADTTTDDAATGTRRLQAATAVVEYDKPSVFDLFVQYDPIYDQAVVDFDEQTDMVALRKVAEEKQHEDSDRDADAGAIAALVIGLIILVGMLSYCLWKGCMMKKGMGSSGGSRNGQTIMVNQSAMSGNTNQGKLDDIM